MNMSKIKEREIEEHKQWGHAKKTLAIDFDGVIHPGSEGWKNGDCYDDPMPGFAEAVVRFESLGFTLVVLTSREGEDITKATEWLHKHGFEHLKVTNVKPPALAYIDDRGVRFTSWRDISYYFS